MRVGGLDNCSPATQSNDTNWRYISIRLPFSATVEPRGLRIAQGRRCHPERWAPSLPGGDLTSPTMA